MNIVERERALNDATRRYLHGEIDYDELTRIRREYAPNYIGALTALVRFQRAARLAAAEAELLARRRRWSWRFWE